MSSRRIRITFCLSGLSLLALLVLTGPSRVSADQQPPAGVEGKPAEEVYKNIQIFKGVPSQAILRGMQFFSRSLGVQCTHCHVLPTYEKDDKPAKLNARKMYQMVQLAQKEIGSNKVSCFMCHRGKVQPEPLPAELQAENDRAMKDADSNKTPAEKEYTNIQVLKGVPAGRIMVIMGMFTQALGVDCTHCHVGANFEKDDKPAKQTARKMLKMTGSIAREIYKGDSPVNCYTCHRGQKEPVAFPPQQAPAEKKG
jgi:hypothetical protein